MDINEAECQACGKSQEEMREWARESMEKYGWYAHYITEYDAQTPTGCNFHTHGADITYGSMDFQIVLAVQVEIAHAIFANLMHELKEGKKFEPGKKYGEVLEGYDVAFKEVVENDRKILRVILPDKEGRVMEGEITEPNSIQWSD